VPKITGNLKSFIEGLLFSLTTSASESLQPFSGKNCQWDAVQGASIRLGSIYPVTVLLKELKAQARVNDVIGFV